VTDVILLFGLFACGLFCLIGCVYRLYPSVAFQKAWYRNTYYSRAERPFDYWWYTVFWIFGTTFGALISLATLFVLIGLLA
jgi:hypothetical protein